MHKNDTVVPFGALLFAVALFLMAFLDNQNRVSETVAIPGAAHSLSVGIIGLMAFGMVMFIYGFIGLVGNYLEGTELRPSKHIAGPSSLPVVAGVVLSLLLVGLAGFFARTLVYAAKEGFNPSSLQGGVFAAMMLIIAILLVIYKKFFMEEEVLAEEEKGEFPW
ncbi:MAG: cytochrome C [Thermaceae bacterium]|nr:cytochrome C [Thermaceae bacterium]